MPDDKHIEKLKSIDIVLSIYNQEKIIKKILGGIFKNTTTPFNLILVFDGCTDNTMQIALDYIDSSKPRLLKNLHTTTAPNVYETKANNIGFRMATEKFLITLQDDMLIEEMGWEKRITYPLRKWSDIFAVTARTALNVNFDDNSDNPKYSKISSREHLTLSRKSFSIRSGINRGPVAFKRGVLEKLNYLDEDFAPAQWDEFDLVLRAYELYKLKSGAFQVDYISKSSWGKTRQSETTMNTNNTYKKNIKLLKKKHPQLLNPNENLIEKRHINESEIDYIHKQNLIEKIKIRISIDTCCIFYFIKRKYTNYKHMVKSFIIKAIKK